MSQSQSLNLSVQVSIPGGPSVAFTTDLETEAYDSIKVTVPAAITNQKVEVQPGGATQVKFLMIQSDIYDDNVEYSVNSETNDKHLLTQPVILSGQGAVGLLDPAPKDLFFSNALAENIQVEVLVGRTATT